MMCAATGFHAHQAWRKICEKLLHRTTPKLTAQNNRARCINPVNLKYVLRQIQTNRANLAHGRSPLLEIFIDLILAHRCRSGAVHPIIARSESDEAIQSYRRVWIASLTLAITEVSDG